MSTLSLIAVPRAPYHRRLSPASKEVVSIHEHRCWKCGETYPGYHAKCKDPFDLLCGECLAEEFR